MAISAYVGLPRAGKSYGVVENVVIPALKTGRVVYSNIPMHDDYCEKTYGSMVRSFTTKDIQENPNFFEELENGAIVIIDELWRLWPAGLKANNVAETHKAFLAEHGHLTGDNGQVTEVILVTQDLSQVANFVRTLVATTYRVVKLDAVGASKRYRVDIYEGAVTGQSPPASKKINQTFGKYKQEVYSAYVSQTKGDGVHGDESRTDNRFNILKGFKLKFIVFFSILLLVFSIYFAKSFLDDTDLIEHQGNSKSSKIINTQESKPTNADLLKQTVKKDDLISKSDNLVFLGTYKETKGLTFHNFRLEVDGHFSLLNQFDLVNLGYTVQVLRPCLAIISIDNDVEYALCRDPNIDSNDVLPI